MTGAISGRVSLAGRRPHLFLRLRVSRSAIGARVQHERFTIDRSALDDDSACGCSAGAPVGVPPTKARPARCKPLTRRCADYGPACRREAIG